MLFSDLENASTRFNMKKLQKGADPLSETTQSFLSKREAHFTLSESSHHHCGCAHCKRRNILSPWPSAFKLIHYKEKKYNSTRETKISSYSQCGYNVGVLLSLGALGGLFVCGFCLFIFILL